MGTRRDHGGDLSRAMAEHGGARHEWIDLSTGINRRPYPVPEIAPEAWRCLPDADAVDATVAAARAAYGTDAPCLPVAGAQAAIQLLPRLGRPSTVRLLRVSYNEHAAAFDAAGWRVETVEDAASLAGAAAAVLVNPNNPDGRASTADAVLGLAGRVGTLIVDESFADATPAVSVAAHAGRIPGLVVLRSFGKFYGLAGVRLGFVLAGADTLARLAALAGPWAVGGPALTVGRIALADAAWRDTMRRQLAADAARLDSLVAGAGWAPVGGTPLFRLYDAGNAAHARAHLARHRIWTRLFPYSEGWLRLGLPGPEAEWRRVADAVRTR